jgi:hypothetical protein
MHRWTLRLLAEKSGRSWLSVRFDRAMSTVGRDSKKNELKPWRCTAVLVLWQAVTAAVCLAKMEDAFWHVYAADRMPRTRPVVCSGRTALLSERRRPSPAGACLSSQGQAATAGLRVRTAWRVCAIAGGMIEPLRGWRKRLAQVHRAVAPGASTRCTFAKHLPPRMQIRAG